MFALISSSNWSIFKAAFKATEHLIKKHSTEIAHFSGPQNLEIYKNRFKGYKAALEKYKTATYTKAWPGGT